MEMLEKGKDSGLKGGKDASRRKRKKKLAWPVRDDKHYTPTPPEQTTTFVQRKLAGDKSGNQFLLILNNQHKLKKKKSDITQGENKGNSWGKKGSETRALSK